MAEQHKTWPAISQEATKKYMKEIREALKGHIKETVKKTFKQNFQQLTAGIGPERAERLFELLNTIHIPYQNSVIQEFEDLINNDAVIRMNFTKMIDQVPGYYITSDEGVYLYSIQEMLHMIDYIITQPPPYNETDLVGFPINTILNWTMGVPAGGAAFRNEKVNEMFRKILKVWTEYLESEDSKKAFSTPGTGWRSPNALEKLKMDQYLDDPEGEWPYESWNEFFIRNFKESDPPQRPIEESDNDKAVVSACDSQVYNIQYQAQLQDWFWVKSQPYSLWDLLGNENGYNGRKPEQSGQEHYDTYVKPFENGTVFQAFLSAFKYHRWNSPVSGTIKKAYVRGGTYYSATQSEGLDQASPDLSQGYIAHTATKALVFIEADDKKIGLMCFIAIGMAEVSSCIINDNIQPDYKVTKGEELGYFQFGGSTHCLVFQDGAIDRFVDPEDHSEELQQDTTIEMGQVIAYGS